MTTDDEIKARGRWNDFKPGSAGSMAHQVADVETDTPEDKAKMWTDAGYDGSAFKDDDFDYDKIEDAKDGDPLRDAYIKAAKTLHEMTGDPTPTNWSNDDWVDFAKSEMSWFSQNSVGLAKWAIRVNSDDATDQQKAAFGYLMELHEHSNTSWGDVGNFLWKGLLADPTTYVGVATFGVGTLAAQGGKEAAKLGIKAAVKAAVKKTVTGSIAYGIKTSLKEGAELTAKRAITKSIGLGVKTGLKNSWKTGGMAVAAENVIQGVGFDYGMQKTKIGVGLQDKYSGWQSVMSGGMGLVFGEVLSPAMAGAGTALGKGVKSMKFSVDDPNIQANGITGKQIKSAWTSIKSAFPKWGSKKTTTSTSTAKIIPDPKKTWLHSFFKYHPYVRWERFGSDASKPHEKVPHEIFSRRFILPIIEAMDKRLEKQGLVEPIQDTSKALLDISSKLKNGEFKNGIADAKKEALKTLKDFSNKHSKELSEYANSLDTISDELKLQTTFLDIAFSSVKGTAQEKATQSAALHKKLQDAIDGFVQKHQKDGYKVSDFQNQVDLIFKTHTDAQGKTTLSFNGDNAYKGSQARLTRNQIDGMLETFARMKSNALDISASDSNAIKNIENALNKIEANDADPIKAATAIEHGFQYFTNLGKDTQVRLDNWDAYSRPFKPKEILGAFGSVFGKWGEKKFNVHDGLEAPFQVIDKQFRIMRASYFNPEVRTAPISNRNLDPTKPGNEENDFLRLIGSLGSRKRGEDGKLNAMTEPELKTVAGFISRLYERGLEEDALTGTWLLLAQMGRTSEDAFPDGIMDILRKDVNTKGGKHYEKFLDALVDTKNNLPHSPIKFDQRDVLNMLYPYMASYVTGRYAPFNKVMATPWRYDNVTKHRNKALKWLWSYPLGAKLVNETGDRGQTLTKVKYDWKFATKPEGFKGGAWANTKHYGNPRNWPSWMKMMTYRPILYPARPLMYSTAWGVKQLKNPWVRSIPLTFLAAGGVAHLAEEGAEWAFNDGEDYSLDLGRRMVFNPTIWAADKVIGTPLRLSADIAIGQANNIAWLTGNGRPIQMDDDAWYNPGSWHINPKTITSFEVAGISPLGDYGTDTDDGTELKTPSDVAGGAHSVAITLPQLKADYEKRQAEADADPNDPDKKKLAETAKQKFETEVQKGKAHIESTIDTINATKKEIAKQQGIIDIAAQKEAELSAAQAELANAQARLEKSQIACDVDAIKQNELSIAEAQEKVTEAQDALDEANQNKADALVEKATAENKLSGLKTSLQSSADDFAIILSALDAKEAAALLEKSEELRAAVKDNKNLNADLVVATKTKENDANSGVGSDDVEGNDDPEGGKKTGDYKSKHDWLPTQGAIQRTFDTITYTGNTTIDNAVADTTTLLGAAWASIKDTASGTFGSLNSTEGGRTAMAVGGGLLSSWLGMSLIGKWFDGTMLGKIPFLGGAIKLVLGIGIFLAGMKGTNHLIQGSSKHTPDNINTDDLDEVKTETETGGGDDKGVDKNQTGSINTKKLLNQNIDNINGNPVEQIDEGAYASLEENENDKVVAIEIQPHDGGEAATLLKSNKDAIIVSLSQTHDGTIAMSGTGKFVDLSVTDPSVEKTAGSKANLLRGMVKDDVQAITMDVESLANVTRDQMSEQEIKLIQLNSGLPSATPDPSNTLGRTV